MVDKDYSVSDNTPVGTDAAVTQIDDLTLPFKLEVLTAAVPTAGANPILFAFDNTGSIELRVIFPNGNQKTLETDA